MNLLQNYRHSFPLFRKAKPLGEKMLCCTDKYSRYYFFIHVFLISRKNTSYLIPNDVINDKIIMFCEEFDFCIN